MNGFYLHMWTKQYKKKRKRLNINISLRFSETMSSRVLQAADSITSARSLHTWFLVNKCFHANFSVLRKCGNEEVSLLLQRTSARGGAASPVFQVLSSPRGPLQVCAQLLIDP